MSAQVISKREVVNPELTVHHDAVQVIPAWTDRGLSEVPPLRKLRFVCRDVLVILRFERGDSPFGVGQPRNTDHDVDDRLRSETGNRRASDMFDERAGAREHRGQERALPFEAERPLGIVRDHRDEWRHA